MKRTIVLLLFAVLCCFSLGCVPKTTQPLRIGTNIWIGYTPFYLARNIGLLPEADYKLIEYASTTEVIRAFRNKSLDLAAVTVDEATLLTKDKFDFKIVLVLDESYGADALVSQPYIKHIKQLKGKKIGVEKSALGGYFLSLFLKNQGWRESDIKIIYMEPSKHTEAFKNKTADAIITFDPMLGQLKKLGGNVLFDSKKTPGKILDILIADSALFDTRSQDIKNLIQIWQKSITFINDNHAKTFEIMKQQNLITSENIDTAFSGLRLMGLKENKNLLTGTIPLKNVLTELHTHINYTNDKKNESAPNLDNLFSVPDSWYDQETSR